MVLKLVSKPIEDVVTLQEAKLHLRVDHSDDDALIDGLIDAATQHAEKFTGLALIDQTWELTLDEFPINEIRINKPPLIAVTSINYDDGDGMEVALDSASYVVDARNEEPSWLLPISSWPSTFDGVNAVRVRFRAGYIDTDSPPRAAVPGPIKSAVLIYLATLYRFRETMGPGSDVSMVPWSAEQLLRPYRVELSLA